MISRLILATSRISSSSSITKTFFVFMGFYEFRRQLEYKTQLYGSKLVVMDRFYPISKTCFLLDELH
ncbi:zinc ribbon domain-containing protein [Anabaena catenula]|uniref:zinc ribbon domain-containing protein n=1 Tax=Anabaena catenula TaxID=1296320 RepID=UPI003BB75F17